MTRASQRHKRAVHGRDSTGKGIAVSKEAGTAASPATAFTDGVFDTGDTVELGVLVNGSTAQVDSVFAATADDTSANDMAAGLAAAINAISGVSAAAVATNVITITPTTSVNLVDARSRRK